MKTLSAQIKEVLPSSRPNSFISYLDNIFACFLFLGLKKIKFLNPNRLTFFSLLLWIVALVGYVFFDFRWWFLLIGFFSYTFDNIDGIWARYFGQSSKMGAWFDETCDRLKDVSILMVFMITFRVTTLFWVATLACFMYMLTLIIEARVEKYFAKKISPPNPQEAERKKSRVIAYGPAEALVLYSAIIILPATYKIVPFTIFCLLMVYIFIRIKKNYEFVESH